MIKQTVFCLDVFYKYSRKIRISYFKICKSYFNFSKTYFKIRNNIFKIRKSDFVKIVSEKNLLVFKTNLLMFNINFLVLNTNFLVRDNIFFVLQYGCVLCETHSFISIDKNNKNIVIKLLSDLKTFLWFFSKFISLQTICCCNKKILIFGYCGAICMIVILQTEIKI